MNTGTLGASTAENVAEDILTQSIEADRRRQRTKWTTEMNEYIVRCYYSITKLETLNTPYSEELHRKVIEKFPELRNKTVQNILDQRRALMHNARITANRLKEIRQTVAMEQGIETERPEQEPAQRQREDVGSVETDVDPEVTRINDMFTRTLVMYDGIEPQYRPKLPKLHEDKGTKKIIDKIDTILQSKITNNTTLQELHFLIYVSAYTTLRAHNQKIRDNSRSTTRCSLAQLPPWERRLDNKINNLRRSIGQITQSQMKDASNKTKRKASDICDKYRDKCRNQAEVLDILKQQLAATSKRLRRYKKSKERREHNALFNRSEKSFYRSLNTNTRARKDNEELVPSTKMIQSFWSDLWSTPAVHTKSKWIQEVKRDIGSLKTMEEWEIKVTEIEYAVKNTANWKAPGPDHIHNFWYKKFKSTHHLLAKLFTGILTQPDNMPSFMTEGITYLLPKTSPASNDPSKYRPITCLPTLYKLLTSVISSKIYGHLERNKLLDEEQKGCRKGSRGCKEQLIIDAVIMEEAKKEKRTVYTAYIDYKKAFDSVPHSWLIEILKLYQINPTITAFLEYAMAKWKTCLTLNTSQESINAGNIEIKRGIFQGDALSPIWFCLSLKPLTTLLNKKQKGYNFKNSPTKLSHLLYMDDLKLYASSKTEMKSLLDITSKFSDDICMQFGMDKCRTCAIVKGAWEPGIRHEARCEQERIPGMEEGEHYKYLGFLQMGGIDYKRAKEELTRKYVARTQQILRTQLTARNKVKALNTYCISILTYSFGIIPWTHTDLNNLDIKTRTLSTKHRFHHPKSSKYRFHLPRIRGGRGVVQLASHHQQQISKLRKYFFNKAETSQLHRAVTESDKGRTPLNLKNKEYLPEANCPSEARIVEQWKAMPLHGKYPSQLDENHIDTKASHSWLCNGNIYGETEGFMISIQDQVVPTKYYRRHVTQTPECLDDKCRMCKEKLETIDHIISGCTILAPTEYTTRHNNVSKIIHQQICRNFNILENSTPYYRYTPERVIENEQCKIYWEWPIITDRHIQHNIPDIVVEDKDNKVTYLLDIAIPLAANIERTHANKITKYLPLAEEIREMWRQERVTILPIVVGATGEIPIKLFDSLEKINIQKNTYKLMQKSVILDTCRIVRMVISGAINMTN